MRVLSPTRNTVPVLSKALPGGRVHEQRIARVDPNPCPPRCHIVAYQIQ